MQNKLLLMSHCLPPILRGPSIIINRLFKESDKNTYGILLSNFTKKNIEYDDSLKLPCEYHSINIETSVGGYSQSVYSILKKWLSSLIIIFTTFNLLYKKKYTSIIVFPTFGNFLLAGWIIKKITGIPFYVYLFDLFASKNNKGLESRLKRFIEKLTFKSADGLFVMSETLQQLYEERYKNLPVTLIRHTVDTSLYKETEVLSSSIKKIVFTGMIYEYQIDAIQNMAKAVNSMADVHFYIYTQRDKEYLDKKGVTGPNIFFCGYASPEKIKNVQKNADILFLPMSFHGPGTNSDIIKTASPSKIAEYLAAEKPIIVHAPKDAYISWFFSKHECGLVVDEPDSKFLILAVKKLIDDNETAKKLIISAKKMAQLHDVKNVRTQFFNSFNKNFIFSIHNIYALLISFWALFIFMLYYKSLMVYLIKSCIGNFT